MEQNQLLPAMLDWTFNRSDSRCRYWLKAWRIQDTPSPANVTGANSLPGEYLRGDQAFEPGTVLATGEENHHRKQRGWNFNFQVVVNVASTRRPGQCQLRDVPFGSDVKPRIAARYRDLAAGSGEHAAMCRSACYIARRAADGLTLVAALAELKGEKHE